MHYDIIFVTNENLNFDLFKNLNCLFLTEASVTKDEVNGNTYDFLVIDRLFPELDLLTEDGFIITNQNFQTINDQVFAIGSIVKSNLEINHQLELVYEKIMNP